MGYQYGCATCNAEADPADGVWTVRKTKRGEVWTKTHYCKEHRPNECQ